MLASPCRCHRLQTVRRRKTDKTSILAVAELSVEVVRKDVRNLNLRVHPATGAVRLSAPRHTADVVIERLIRDKLEWIRAQRRRADNRTDAAPPALVSGERHSFQGQACVLEVIEQQGRQGASLGGEQRLTLRVRPGASREQREAVLWRWYRQQMKALIPDLLALWEPRVGVSVAEWGVKYMRSRWGSCNISARRIWLNLELIRRPPECLAYVLVHELVHLRERYHNECFYRLLGEAMPDWRRHRETLHGDAPASAEPVC